MLHGRELVHGGTDFKPLVLQHGEDPCKQGVNSSPSKNMAIGGNSNPGQGQSGTSNTDACEAPRNGPARPWPSSAVHPSLAPEVVQLRRLQYRELTPEDYELLCLLDENVPKKNTTPQDLVSGLPRVLARDCHSNECHICLARLDPLIFVAQLPCGHAFHPECVSRWLTQCKGTCPLCLSPIECDLDVIHPDDKPLKDSVMTEVDAAVKIAIRTATRCGGIAREGPCAIRSARDDGPAE